MILYIFLIYLYLHLSYKRLIKKWQLSTEEDKLIIKIQKKKIQEVNLDPNWVL